MERIRKYNTLLSFVGKTRFPQLLLVAWILCCPTCMIGAFYLNLQRSQPALLSAKANCNIVMVSSQRRELRPSQYCMKPFTLLASVVTSVDHEASTDNNDGDNKRDRRLVWNRLFEYFQGDFDNYRQVVEDRQKNLLPKEGGGHEHFHCTLIPLNGTSRLAAFYFDGNPTRIFRFRYYELVDDVPISQGNSHTSSLSTDEDNLLRITDFDTVEMRLYTLHPTLEGILRANAVDPLSWPAIFESFEPPSVKEPKLNLLPKCEITWSMEKDPVQHSYAIDIPEARVHDGPHNDDDDESGVESRRSLHAVMLHGQAIVESTIVPGMQIRIVDQLSLYDDVFYINDRGFDPISGAFIYGNQRGVPYRLERVTSLSGIPSSSSSSASLEHDEISSDQSSRSNIQRDVVDPDLKWTLGPQWRTTDEYEIRLQAIGGPSAGISKKDFTKNNTTQKKK